VEQTSQRVSDEDAAHMMMIAMLGSTAKHLRERHGVEPGDDKRENLGLHMEAHGYDRQAKASRWWTSHWGGLWSRRHHGTPATALRPPGLPTRIRSERDTD